MNRSSTLFNEAKEFIPGGVNSPVRAFNGVGGEPIFFERALGAYLYDVDGNSYIDYVGSWGPMILGHANPVIIDAVKAVLDKGAVKAIGQRKSLLSVGVVEYLGDFDKGEVIELLDISRNPVAIARTKCSKSELQQTNSSIEVAHADDIVIW